VVETVEAGGGGGGGGGRSGGGVSQPAATGVGTAVPESTTPSLPVSTEPALTPSSDLPQVQGLLTATVSGRTVVFHDVPVSQWFAPAVYWALQSGIASGYKDAAGNLTGQFGPENPVTFAELAKLALGAAGKQPDWEHKAPDESLCKEPMVGGVHPHRRNAQALGVPAHTQV